MPTILLVDLRSLELMVSRSENLPVLPQIVSQVLTLADDPNASSRTMERLIESDPAIAAKILRVASSAFYGSNSMTTIGRAISVLGMNTIRALVVGIAYQQVIGGRTTSQSFSKVEFWRHCLATGIASRVIGKIVLPAKADDLYCAGMLHDVGMLVMDRFAPQDLDSVLSKAKECGQQIHVMEEQELGFDHARVGEILANRWNLSPMAKAAIRWHHDVCEDDEHHVTTCIVAASNWLATSAGYCVLHDLPVEPLDPVVNAALNLPEGQLEVILQVLPAEVQKYEEAFGIA